MHVAEFAIFPVLWTEIENRHEKCALILSQASRRTRLITLLLIHLMKFYRIKQYKRFKQRINLYFISHSRIL